METLKQLYPLFFKPAYKDYLWGGDQIIRYFEREAPEGIYAESWEVSDRKEGMSIVSNGPLSGLSLEQLIAKYPKDVLGSQAQLEHFPLLIKLIDAKQTLSVQVHPNDKTAKQYGGEAKTEAWYVIAAEEGAKVYAGFKKGVSKEVIQEKLTSSQIVDVMQHIPVKSGEMIFIPGGRLHAIGAGCLIFEVQQNSNTTYRVYDWGRGRELHLKEASKVLNWDDDQNAAIEADSEGILLQTPYFQIDKWEINHSQSFDVASHGCVVLFLLSGKGSIHHAYGKDEWKKGSSCLIPAECGEIMIEVEEGPLSILKISP